MPTTIVRSPKDRTHPYATLDNRLIEDPALSWKAKGLVAYLLSRPDGWEIRAADLVKRSADGETAVRSGLKELETRGYLVRRALRDPRTGHFTGYQLTVYECPQSSDANTPVDAGPPAAVGQPAAVSTDLTEDGPTEGLSGSQGPDTTAVASPPADRQRQASPSVVCPSPATPELVIPQGVPPYVGTPSMVPPDAGPPGAGNPDPDDSAPSKTNMTKTEDNNQDVVVVPPYPPIDPVLAHVVGLYEQEIGGTLTAMIHDELTDLVTHECRDLERWRAAFRASIGARNRWHYTRAIILHPERKPPKEVKPHGTPNTRSCSHRSPRRRSARAAGYTLPTQAEIDRVNREAAARLHQAETCTEPTPAA